MESNMDNKIMVSVVMICYNHEKYIRKAIESVISQQTNFKFEILIHDDASIDGSANIIKEYEKKYSDIINPIYQHENQTSKGVGIIRRYIDPNIKGKYIAFCECDDYWCDSLKLQKQVDFLEKNPTYSATSHNNFIIDENDNEVELRRDIYPRMMEHDITLKEYAMGVCYPGQSAAMVCRREAYFLKEEREVDYYRMRVDTGDTKRNLKVLLWGDIHYFSDYMSAHRVVINSGGSWSARNNGKNRLAANFIASIDMRKYAKKHFNKTYSNLNLTFSNGILSIIRYITNPNEENKKAFTIVCKEKHNIVGLLLYLFVISVPSIILRIERSILRKKYILTEANMGYEQCKIK